MPKARPFSFLVQDGLPGQVNLYCCGKKNSCFTEATLEGTLVTPEADVSLDETALCGALHAENMFVGANSSFVSHAKPLGAQKSLCNDTF
mmetsp:Transcript_6374/g.9388  ORF Transcript_6374/g.9388 Transcript_6374/m.9388 type:complete len:90 (-) Transcript_6374:58-327(-)